MELKDFSFIKEYLESGMSQIAFAKTKGLTFVQTRRILWNQMMMMYKIGLVIPGEYACEIRYAKKHKVEILKAIKIYEDTR